ncbi:hypothetical protein [uncultured Enterococcus sp.]|uniref:hypothetical protein n=1 Tax=uncultured Enterococcus sp. TaxID=167972 RepID=UPI002AA79871|nr:hypothetical protein [uncultured Enterococcus sp.]
MSKNITELIDLLSQLSDFVKETPLEEIKEEIEMVADESIHEERTVKSLLSDLHELTKWDSKYVVDGKEQYVSDDYKGFIGDHVTQIAELLGIDFEG